tara:strand:- start:31 stop:666 length:636 start_codon:yes stop_codon:yes gene_type:complete
MNWLDFVLLATLIISALVGMRIGLLGAAFAVGGIVIGWLLAGKYSDDVGALIGGNLTADTIITVASYAIIILASLVATNIALKFARPMLAIFTLGLSSLVDRIGGLALGLTIGIALTGALIICLARLTYNFDTESIVEPISKQIPGQPSMPTETLAKVDNVRENLEKSLINSKLVSIFIDSTSALPGQALGFVQDDFRVALDILKVSIEPE